ncbi:hypothetical protein AB0M45_24720 [Nocardia sp. NPDC051787]|uniref:hypothetical protein n=1 Tax=Nocardia sp. NPDC051787 TaxID=3155415 RepID=UPI00343929BD
MTGRRGFDDSFMRVINAAATQHLRETVFQRMKLPDLSKLVGPSFNISGFTDLKRSFPVADLIGKGIPPILSAAEYGPGKLGVPDLFSDSASIRMMQASALNSVTRNLLKLDMSIVPVIDTAALLSKDLLTLRIPKIELPDIGGILEELAKRWPHNWPDDPPDFALAKQIVEEEGIPIVYIPRGEIVSELVAEPDRAGRVAVLVARTPEILDDCAEALDEPLGDEVVALRPLIRRAIRALRENHFEAAQALCISICDTLITAHIDGKHNKAKSVCVVKNLDAAFSANQLRYVLGVGPVVNLLTEWSPKSPKPRPEALSRHVTIHQAHPEHFTRDNAIIAVMVATSLMLALNERYSWG